ncbi:MAG: peptidoglycan DD-metalloendopeptidase family protein [Anaerolineaceae bacterium]|nr:peptidoglycan DD-metalloendopeptidase family protein [Anaerolineaceae bacterium]
MGLVFTTTVVKAQDNQLSGPVYIVRAGDTLSTIAEKFGVALTALLEENSIVNPNLLAIGTKLIIPGLEGVEGVLVGQTMPLGETYTSFTRRYGVLPALLNRINRVTSPGELYAGAELIVPQKQPAAKRILAAPEQTLLELAALHSSSRWTLTAENHLSGSWDIYPHDVLYLQGGGNDIGSDSILPGVLRLDMTPLPLIQGKTTVIKVETDTAAALGGSLDGNELNFFQQIDNQQVAITGVHAFTQPGIITFRLISKLPSGETYTLEQMVILRSGNYSRDAPLSVKEEYVDPAVTEPENEQVISITAPRNAERYWSGAFTPPSPYPDCLTSTFGKRRSYNNSNWTYFHTGMDFCGGTGVEIYAAAPGVVVFAGPLVVRGNATILSHGWGVYTGYWHQSEIRVQPGERVEAGQVIGLVGNTGRSTGAHLHWEVWAGGVQVDPQDWLAQVFP